MTDLFEEHCGEALRVPDPRDLKRNCVLLLDEDAVRHMIWEHVAGECVGTSNGELQWEVQGSLETWWDKTEFDALRDAYRSGYPSRAAAAIPVVVGLIYHAAKESGDRPFAVVYFQTSAPNANKDMWVYLLRSGVRLVFEGSDADTAKVKSCHAPDGLEHEPVEERWRRVARRMIESYTPLGTRILPARHQETNPAPGKVAIRVRFVRHEFWGFPSDRPGTRWSGDIPDWPALIDSRGEA